MKKILFATALFLGVAATSFAQDGGGKFSIGVEGGLPIGTAADAYKFGIGGSLKYDHPIAEKTFFTLSAGYTSFQGKTITVSGGGVTLTGKVESAGFVPVKAGIKYFLADSFYGEAQVGAAFSTQSGGGTAFAYAPGIGYKFSDAIDFGVRFEGWSKDGSFNQIGGRLAYSF